MIKSISSPSNPLIKNLIALIEKAKFRKESGSFVVEGKKEISMAIQGGYSPSLMIFDPSIITYNQLFEYYGNVLFDIEMVEVTHPVYIKIAYRESTEGVIAVFKQKNIFLDNLVLSKDCPLILVAESPEKPGNIGALLRTADAAGVDAVLIANPHTDMYNPNTIRSSIGTLFTLQIAVGSSDEIIQYLKKKKIQIMAATLSQHAVSCYATNFRPSTAIVVGTESWGLTEEWIQAADQNVIIPMYGKIDSMNVSISAAILIFEAIRQRLHQSVH